MPFRHQLRIRYGEVDMQKVVFNAHYLAYADDAFTRWSEEVGEPWAEESDGEWDCMVVASHLDWQGSATFDDVLDIECSVARWGTTSFVLRFAMHVAERPVCTVETTYVGVRRGTTQKLAPPESFRAALDPSS